MKSFKRVENFKYQGHFYIIYVNKNDSVYDLKKSEVISWKEVNKNGRTICVPDVCENVSDPTLLNKIKGNQYKIAIGKIMTEIERLSI